MKRPVITQFAQRKSYRLISAALFLIPAFKVNATEFIDMLRMTADHPSIMSAVSSTSAAYFDIEQAKAAKNIQLSAGLSSTTYSGQPGYEDNPIAPHISISKILYDHGRTDDTVEGKKAVFSMQQSQVSVARETLNQQVLSLFTTVVTNARVVAVLDQEIAALRDLLERVKNISSIDSGRASEINQVATRLSSVVASREMSNTSQQQAWRQLSLLLNRKITLTSGLPDLKKAGLLPDTLDIALQALTDNPSYIVSRYKRDAERASLQLASKWNRPQWSVQLSLDSPRNNGEMEPLKAVTLQVSSDMSLWDGGAGRAAEKGQIQRLTSAEQDMDSTLRSLRQQLEQLWISLPLRQQQINALELQSESAMKTWKAGEAQFFASQRPLTDLISFVTDYYSSMASLEEQKVQYIATQWQIIAALGKLSTLVQQVPKLPGSVLTLTPDVKKKDNVIKGLNKHVVSESKNDGMSSSGKNIESSLTAKNRVLLAPEPKLIFSKDVVEKSPTIVSEQPMTSHLLTKNIVKATPSQQSSSLIKDGNSVSYRAE
ncbi:hypothetical protein GIX45_01210 [Erwinia sp. CPCC 100877]|nr:hypothetical protein [Erwinia sp. CPCC 100877]